MLKDVKEKAPVFLSPKFFGVVAFVVVGYLQVRGFIGGPEVEALETIIMYALGIGVADSLARKIGGKK